MGEGTLGGERAVEGQFGDLTHEGGEGEGGGGGGAGGVAPHIESVAGVAGITGDTIDASVRLPLVVATTA